MQRRVLQVTVLAVLVAATTINAQEPAAAGRLGRCFTPVSTPVVYFEVTADGPTERVLRMTTQSPKQTVKHSQVHQPAPSIELYTPPIHAVHLRKTGPLPTLLTPQRITENPPTRTHRHDYVDLVADSEVGSTGCRVRLHHTIR